MVADVAAAWKLNDQVSLTARVDNVTDEDHQEAFGYAERGRAIYVGVRVRN